MAAMTWSAFRQAFLKSFNASVASIKKSPAPRKLKPSGNSLPTTRRQRLFALLADADREEAKRTELILPTSGDPIRFSALERSWIQLLASGRRKYIPPSLDFRALESRLLAIEEARSNSFREEARRLRDDWYGQKASLAE
jgi:hypothetical protein